MINICIIDKLNNYIYFCVCLFAFFSCISIAAANVFLVISILLSVLEIISNKDKFKDKFKSIFKEFKYTFIGIILFFIAIFISVFFSDNILKSIKIFFEYYIYRAFPLFLVLFFIDNRKKIAIIITCVILSFTIANIFAIVQFSLTGILRSSSFAANPMSLAGFLVIVTPIIFVEVLNNKKNIPKSISIILLFISLVALIVNATRGAWVSLVIVIPMLMILLNNIKTSKKIIYCILPFIIVISIIFNNELIEKRVDSIVDLNNQSNAERILLWKSSYNMFLDNPIFGVGIGMFKNKYQNEYILPEAKIRYLGHAHNNFIHILAENGIVGLTMFINMIIILFIDFIKKWYRTKVISCVMFIGAFFGFLIQGLTEYNFGNSAVVKLFWLILALSIKDYILYMELISKGEK